MDYVCFKPIYKERVWGGQKISSFLNRNIPNIPIGESWEIVDRAEDQSLTEGGISLASLRQSIMGPSWPKEKLFPIIVKWLDCSQQLSLQVHPPAEIAPHLQGEPKSENWYVVQAEKDAKIIFGLNQPLTKEQFKDALLNNTLEPLLHQEPVSKGDSIFIPSGRLHAIGAGSLILEIQQNSDTTYRVYDWGRPRPLHIDQALQSINFNDLRPKKTQDPHILVDSPLFRIRRFTQGTILLDKGPYILSIVEGHATLNGTKEFKGTNCIIPYDKKINLNISQNSVILVTDQFNHL